MKEPPVLKQKSLQKTKTNHQENPNWFLEETTSFLSISAPVLGLPSSPLERCATEAGLPPAQLAQAAAPSGLRWAAAAAAGPRGSGRTIALSFPTKRHYRELRTIWKGGFSRVRVAGPPGNSAVAPQSPAHPAKEPTRSHPLHGK